LALPDAGGDLDVHCQSDSIGHTDADRHTHADR